MDIKKLEESYEYFLTKLNHAQYKKIDHEVAKSFKGLPEELIYIWKKYGFCSFGDGIWWHTDPKDYDDIVEMWLKGTPYWQPDSNPYHVIGRLLLVNLSSGVQKLD